MSKRLVYLTILVLVAALVGNVSAELVGHWKFDEGSGPTAYDSAGDNDGTLINGPQWMSGQIDGALSFDGVDDYVEIAWDESLANVTDNFTILLWAQPLSTHQIDPETNSGWGGTSGQKYAISPSHGDYWWGSGHAGAGISIGTNGISVYEHAANYMPAILVWSGSVSGITHVAVVYSDKQPRLYINGESKKTGQQSSKTVHIWPNYIGGHSYGYFNGLIDDVRIYDQALLAEEVQQLYIGGLSRKAINPNPTDGATGVNPDVMLSWSPGLLAASHDVYFGTDFDAVNNASTSSSIYKGTQNLDANSYDPCGLLDLGTTYYWRIDEVNNPSTWKGDVWHLEVEEYIVVDDMESYNDDTNQVTDTWKVWPYPDANNGAYVYLEQVIIHGAEKSMQFDFDSVSFSYVTATRIYPAAQNWAVCGANHLSLWVPRLYV